AISGPPSAEAGQTVVFNASNSIHLDPDGYILKYTWGLWAPGETMAQYTYEGVTFTHQFSSLANNGTWRIVLSVTDNFGVTYSESRPFSLPYKTEATLVIHTPYPVHNLDTGLNYTTIQQAIDAPETLNGHRIFVEARIYYENIDVWKAIRLVGENRKTTILDGDQVDNTAKVTVDNVSIIGFTIQNSGSEWQHDFGVDLSGRRNCRVENCIIQNHAYSVYLSSAVNNTIRNNIIANTTSYAIMMRWFSKDNIIFNNTLIHNNCGVEIEEDCEANVIAYNNITLTSYHAMYLLRSNANFIRNNLLSFNGYANPPGIFSAIKLMYSSNNTLANNLIFNNTGGIQVYFKMASKPARYNIFKNNTIEDNSLGVIIDYMGNQSHPSTGTYNQLCENTFQNNDYGIYLIGSDNNTFSHNNFLGSIYNDVTSVNSTNAWDSNFEGNYWNNYTGVDSDQDGIGNTPHVIDTNNTDNYPLMGMFSSFNITSEHYVQIICNSTISDFQHNGTAISFDVTGENGTSGFCRICIPKALMNETYRVFVNGTEILPSPEILPFSNSTHSFLYFTYDLSTKEVVIIPEFPSLIILSLFMVTCLAVSFVWKRLQTRITHPYL
ncbi:MAG: right-handed parallel beta-helix repeat-containing protein, partial [Candidatus Bathyarchaeota archaeon]|nr:right-handed parallel beta-helix repeat-containing protein [Candidatus Bathyarchaeota archaeon]